MNTTPRIDVARWDPRTDLIEEKMPLPHFLGIGAMKAGSTLLWKLLDEHPAVCMARDRKEVRFFDHHYDRGASWYTALWDHAGPDQIRGEVSPNYIWNPDAAARMAETVPEARIIAVLRDPAKRAYSQYKHAIVEEGETSDLRSFLADHPDVIDRGRYHTQLQRYLEHFPRERVHIVLFEEFVKDPAGVIAGVYAFLGIDDRFVPPSADRQVNRSAVPRFHRVYVFGRRVLKFLHRNDLSWVVEGMKRVGAKRVFFRRGDAGVRFPPLSEVDRRWLDEQYRNETAALSDLMGRDLSTVWGS